MVIGAFPIAKLSVLLIKQISKPIANACKERAKSHPFFRTYVCMPPATFYNWCEVKAKMWILNLGKPVNIPVLSQDMAIELGANLLGEAVIFTIGSLLLIFEYNRQSNKEAAKELKRIQELEYLNTTLKQLYYSVQEQETKIKEIELKLKMPYKDNTILPKEAPSIPIPELPDHLKSKLPQVPNGEPAEPTNGGTTQPSNETPTESPSAAQPSTDKCDNLNKPININYYRHNMYSDHNTLTPYPNTGIILKSLNYLQMDAIPGTFRDVNNNNESSFAGETPLHNDKRQIGIVNRALKDVENNLSSMF